MHIVSQPVRMSVALACALTAAAHAENWPQWRGPALNGTTTEKNLPTQWSKTENLAWVTPLPGKSGATPVIWGDSVFVPSPENTNVCLFCIDKNTGAVRWKKVVGSGDKAIYKNNMASPSAIVDGKRVYALFGTSDFAAFDLAGNEIWHRRLSEEFGAFALQFLYGSSPLLLNGKLYVPILQHNPPKYGHAVDSKPDRPSYLVCIDSETGKTLWSHVRKTDAIDESMEAYTTPIPWQGPNGMEIIVVGGDCVTAHRPDNGEEIWRYSKLNQSHKRDGRVVPSAVVSGNLIYACGPKREGVVALRGDSKTEAEQVAWRWTNNAPDVCTPLVYQNKLFVLDGDKRVITAMNPATGEVIWQGTIEGEGVFNASPTGADGKLYFISEKGTAVVMSAGDKFEVLSTFDTEEGPVSGSVAVSDGRLFIRTAKNLYCIKSK